MLRKLLLVEDEEHLRNHKGSGNVIYLIGEKYNSVV